MAQTDKQVPSTAATGDRQEYLVFCLGQESYAIDILRVQEIRGYDAVTRIASAPAFIKGVINLRGTIVPIVDLRIKFQLGKPSYDQFTVVIILNLGARVIGIVVDAVSDVVGLAPADIKPPPEFGATLDLAYLTGLATQGEQLLILLDIEKLMLSPEMALVGAELNSSPAI